MKMHVQDITTIEGFRLGNAEDAEKGTGCTVIICESGAVGGVDVRGGGPATRETDLLRSENTVNAVNAVVLSGGSAFGLEAASGVMRELSDRKIGFDVGDNIVVPIVCGASLYDLPVGDPKAFPDVEMGRQAVQNAYECVFTHGNHGAGTGATVGKLRGYDRAMKSGLGTFACGDDYVQVGAVAAVNAVGDVYNGPGNIIAGLRSEDGKSIFGTIKTMQGMVHDHSGLADDSTSFINRADIEAALASKEQEQPAVNDEPEPQINNEPSDADHETATDTDSKAPASYDDLEAAASEFMPEPVITDLPAEEEPEVVQPAEPETQDYDPEEYEVSELSSVVEAEAAESEEVFECGKEDEGRAEENRIEEIRAEEIQTEEIQAEENRGDECMISEEAEVSDISGAEEESPVALSSEEMGYDITFNTTVGCLITNAALTKSQANKLASILHDAYARSIKPVHGTLDGDTIFVLTTGKQQVNFDAFAALATDVMQYAIIDGALSAEGAYGLPSAQDMKKAENNG